MMATIFPGDVVTIGKGKVHWEVCTVSPVVMILRSGMTERRKIIRRADFHTLTLFKKGPQHVPA